MEDGVFTIFIDRIEGKFAVCEFPDDSMKDIPLWQFFDEVKERDKFMARYDELGNLEVLFKIRFLPMPKNSQVEKIKRDARFIRF